MYHLMYKRRLFTTAVLLTAGVLLLATLFIWRVNTYATSPAPSTESLRKPAVTVAGDWSRYLYSDKHQGVNPAETYLSKSSLASLSLKWKFATKGRLAAEPVVVNGIVYQPSWDGYVYAINASSGTQAWKTFLGVYTSPQCQSYHRGASGTAVVNNGVVYASAGRYFYALRTTDGSIIWNTTLGTSGTDNDFIWAGAALANGTIYVGVASLCDNPLTQGMLYALNKTDGSIAAQAKMVPDGSLGGGIWNVPTIDLATNTVIVTTGSIEKTKRIPMTAAIASFDLKTLAVKQYWQVPVNDLYGDADWGCTVTLFPGPGGKTYVGCINKNNIYYVFDEAHISAGPIWQQRLAAAGDHGGVDGSFATAPYLNGILYISTVNTVIDGISYGGSIGAFDALTGTQLWRFGTASHLVGSPIIANGLLYDGQGKTMEVRDLTTGQVLFSYTVGNIMGSVTVANGVVYLPSFDMNLYALTA
jgi:outer membrane protein assembly factor BamB